MSNQYISRVLRYCLITLRWLGSASIGFALIYFSGTFVINHLLPRTYAGAALVQLRATPESGGASGTGTLGDPVLSAQAAAAQSDAVLGQVVQQLDLQHAWARGDDKAKDGEISSEEALSRLREQVQVRFISGTNILDLVATSSDSQEAADLANALSDAYKSQTQTAPQRVNALILTRAATPQIPTRPNIPFDTLVVLALAIFLGASLASFVEILLLFRRAGDRVGNEA
jgi:uncharacterized protein involved in exopolysaccharide biosynthesis